MAKLVFHPNAYLSETRNVQQGLASRTKILRILERKSATANIVAKESGLNYSVVLHHLRLLAAEKIVSRKTSKKPYFWKLTGIGQQRLKTI
ncbi:MAG: winged helix-turn-helix domain-containing protein [Candidatus Bathyarchaeia archaeon]